MDFYRNLDTDQKNQLKRDTCIYSIIRFGEIKESLNNITTSEKIRNWIKDFNSHIRTYDNLMDALELFKSINEISSLYNLIKSTLKSNNESIINRIIENLPENTQRKSIFIIITSIYPLLRYINIEKNIEFGRDSDDILAFCLFFGLDDRYDIKIRIQMSKLISDILPKNTFIQIIMEFILREQNYSIKTNLLKYINHHSSKNLLKSFKKTNPELKKRIWADEMLLMSLIDENIIYEDFQFFLNQINDYPIFQSINLLEKLANNMDENIRYETLDIIINKKIDNDQIRELIQVLM
ncbi:MAG: hypothetical protein GF329_17110 [Candidatus Lokiarchaeota archaeon]|nr:hypothetical protein [Candidatus Lokiarchaeota archaeon]